MNSKCALAACVGLMALCPLQTKGDAQTQEKPIVQIPQPGVPQIMTMEGKFVRAWYNNEGYVILGYQASNRSVGEEWMLLEVGMTVLDKMPDYRLTRDALSLETPDGKTIPLATVSEQREGTPRQSSNGRRSSAIPSTTFRRARAGRAPSCSFPSSDLGRCRTTWWMSATTAPVSVVSISDSWRYRLRPALAQREVPEEPRACALSDPDRGRREAPIEELQEHREAGQRGVQAEEVTDRARLLRADVTAGDWPAASLRRS